MTDLESLIEEIKASPFITLFTTQVNGIYLHLNCPTLFLNDDFIINVLDDDRISINHKTFVSAVSFSKEDFKLFLTEVIKTTLEKWLALVESKLLSVEPNLHIINTGVSDNILVFVDFVIPNKNGKFTCRITRSGKYEFYKDGELIATAYNYMFFGLTFADIHKLY
jgi:hypothetical protein